MAEVIGDICFPIGKYIDKNTNEEKTRWGKAGVLLKTDKGYRGKLDMVPAAAGEDGGWFSVFERDDSPRHTQNSAPAPSQAPKQTEPDVPF